MLQRVSPLSWKKNVKVQERKSKEKGLIRGITFILNVFAHLKLPLWLSGKSKSIWNTMGSYF